MSDTEVTDLLEPLAGPSTAPNGLSPANLLSLPTNELTTEIIQSSLAPLTDCEAIETCTKLLDRGVEDRAVISTLIDLGLSRGEASKHRMEGSVIAALKLDREEVKWEDVDAEGLSIRLEEALNSNETDRTILRSCVLLAQYKKRLETYNSFAPSTEAGPSTSRPGNQQMEVGDQDMDLDDPWAESTDEPVVDDPWETNSVRSSGSTRSTREPTKPAIPSAEINEPPPLSISSFLSTPLPDSSSTLASAAAVNALRIVWQRHTAELWKYRFAIIDALPPWVSPVELSDIGVLPSVSADGIEPPAPSADASFAEIVYPILFPPTAALTTRTDRLSAEQLKEWYEARVLSLDIFGLLDLQLAWVQHGAALGVPGLDALGEDISLLSRLVYDAHLSPMQQSDWSLASWRQATPTAIIKAYLSNATPDNIVADIQHLVLPYLYVLESRAERAGQDSKDLVESHLHDIILTLPLHLVQPVFEASKATTPTAERIIKNDLTVARLALACLYGSNTRDAWTVKSAIFECLPVWDVTGGDIESDKEATATTLDSIATFVRPTRAGAHPPTATDLFLFFNPLPFASLSRALDILDVHLESGEILARWDTAIQLRFLLQSARNGAEQKELAEKMVRRQVNMTETRWIALWGDMRKLNGGGDALLRGAFGVLSIPEMLEIYLGGVLAAGKYDVARRILKRLEAEVEGGVPPAMLEKVVLVASREFYENAESGNIHTGEMKLAYDCLAVAPTSPAITHERDFIEATSRLSTFSLPSPSGSGTLSPIEIRHAKSKLSLVASVLHHSSDAYRHPDLIHDLAHKLGYADGPSKIRITAMLAASARRNEDYEVAYTYCQDMVNLPHKKDADGVIWKELLALGDNGEFSDIEKKGRVLAQAIERCPAEEIPQILAIWRGVETGQMRLTDAAKRRRQTGVKGGTASKRSSVISNSSAHGGGPGIVGEERVLGSRTAARAARLAMGFAGQRLNLRGIAPSPTLPASDGDTWGRLSGESDRPSFGAMFDGAGVKAGTAEADRVRQQARKALVRGMGWLLGADESEMEGE